MSSAVAASASVHSRRAGQPGQHEVADALRPGAERDEEQRLDADRLRGTPGSARPASWSIGLANGRSGRDDRDLLDPPGLVGGGLGDLDQLGAELDLGAGRRSRCGRGRRRRWLNVWIHMPAARKPSTSASRLSATIRSRLSWAVAWRTIRRAACAIRTWSASSSRSSATTHGAAGLLGVLVEHGALRLARAPAVDGQVHREGAAQHAAGRRTAGRSAGRAGARRPGVVDRLDVGDPAPGLAGAGSSRSCGTNRSRPQSSAFVELLRASRSTGVRGALELGAGLRRCPRRPPTRACRPSRTTLIAAIPKPASSVTPSAISWSASREAASDQRGRSRLGSAGRRPGASFLVFLGRRAHGRRMALGRSSGTARGAPGLGGAGRRP